LTVPALVDVSTQLTLSVIIGAASSPPEELELEVEPPEPEELDDAPPPDPEELPLPLEPLLAPELDPEPESVCPNVPVVAGAGDRQATLPNHTMLRRLRKTKVWIVFATASMVVRSEAIRLKNRQRQGIKKCAASSRKRTLIGRERTRATPPRASGRTPCYKAPQREDPMYDVRALNELVAKESAFVDRLSNEVGKVIVGQQYMVERILVGLLTGGHVLLEGVPGLAKTLTVRTLCDAIHAKFARIQFTPDLLPADLVGTVVYNQQRGEFTSKLGPIFANLVLADEINRAPAKVQSALLEAMQERQVTIGDKTYPLPEPFIVMATQNPIEQEGTYPLPEAQIDRFMLMVKVGYPTREEERKIMDRMTQPELTKAEPVVTPVELLEARKVVKQVYVDEKVKEYIVDVVFATREPAKHGMKDLAALVEYGASPRASIALNLAARAHAFLRHRGYVTPEDVKAIGPDVLRHRLVLTYEADAEEVTSEQIVKRVFEVVEVP
jgi:MoxR-like ATPase